MTGLVSHFLGHAFIALHSIHPTEQLTSGIPSPVIGDSIEQASSGDNRFTSTLFMLFSDIDISTGIVGF